MTFGNSHPAPLTREELRTLWPTATVVLDASVLLQLYRYSKELRDEWTGVLHGMGDRLFLPDQAVREFYRNRANVLVDLRSAIPASEERIKRARATLEAEIGRLLRRHPRVQADDILMPLGDAFDDTLAKLAEERSRDELTTSEDLLSEDEVHEQLRPLFEAHKGESYPPEREAEIWEKGANRYEQGIPPGYLDTDKGDRERFGDLILWFQTIDHARSKQQLVLLVTDDRKEDWWDIRNGQRLGPRPELDEELRKEAGVGLQMYTSERFLSWAKRYQGETDDPEGPEPLDEEAGEVADENLADVDLPAEPSRVGTTTSFVPPPTRSAQPAFVPDHTVVGRRVTLRIFVGTDPTTIGSTWLSSIKCVVRDPTGTVTVADIPAYTYRINGWLSVEYPDYFPGANLPVAGDYRVDWATSLASIHGALITVAYDAFTLY